MGGPAIEWNERFLFLRQVGNDEPQRRVNSLLSFLGEGTFPLQGEGKVAKAECVEEYSLFLDLEGRAKKASSYIN